jgi:hypothetical protein
MLKLLLIISKYAADKISFIRGTFSINAKKMMPASISFNENSQSMKNLLSYSHYQFKMILELLLIFSKSNKN